MQFIDECGREAALKLNKTLLHGMRISVLPSKFPAVIEEKSKGDDSMMDVSNHDSVDNKGGKEERSPSKVWLIPHAANKVSLRPRGLDLKGKMPTKPPKKLHVEDASVKPEGIDAPSPSQTNTSAKPLSNEDFRKFFN